MANLSSLSRKKQVLKYLVDRANQWVNGPEVANERVGGSEGHRRARELRSEGYPIEIRRHPDPRRDIWQYRYVSTKASDGQQESPTLWDVSATRSAAEDFKKGLEGL